MKPLSPSPKEKMQVTSEAPNMPSPPNHVASYSALTRSSLVKHDKLEEQVVLDATMIAERKQQECKRFSETLKTLGSELPDDYIRNMVAKVDGLDPMKRFFTDTNDRPVGMGT